ncbi:MAG TPA: TPM domain-containing protein [Hyphomicrobiaceae bacterium]|jgi:putative membrane protein|nr:TPM domain-containing protein [Hyphomicrobiaceae bacterium]
MVFISEMDRARIADAITAAEAGTSGEIVAIIAPASARYLHVPVLWAALAALALPFPFIYWTWWPIQHIYALQIATFAVLALVLMYPPIRMALVPTAVKRRRAHRRAVEQFLTQNLHTAAAHTGVLIFVSVAERFAEVLADTEINARVPESTWQTIVDELTADIGRGQPAEGFIRAIGAVGRHLAQHFPPKAEGARALPNHLIVLPAD